MDPKTHIPVLTLSLLVAAGSALAQGASVTTRPDGSLSAGVQVPGAAPLRVEAGQGRVATTPPLCTTTTADGRAITVTSPDGRSSASAWASGPGASAVAGAGSPGSLATTHPPRRDPACPPDATAQATARSGQSGETP